MRRHNPKNERIKRRYLGYLEEAKGLSVTSADHAAAAIALFEASTGYKDFANFHIEQARRFKRLQLEEINGITGKPLAKATIHSRVMTLRAFFQWLASQPGYRSLSYADAEYFNLSANDSRIATATRERAVPSLEQIGHVIAFTNCQNEIDRRDRALIALTLASGMRDNAIASLRLRHVDTERQTVFQDARAVRTKGRKTFTSWFFPVGDEPERIVCDWVGYLVTERLFGPDDPLFPATRILPNNDGLFGAAGLNRQGWANADPIRRIFRERFEAAGLPYFVPHLFRKTLAQLGERMCTTAEEWKAWSQNLGHEHVATTFCSYGNVAAHRQGELFERLRDRRLPASGQDEDLTPETIRRVLRLMADRAA